MRKRIERKKEIGENERKEGRGKEKRKKRK